MDKSAQRISPKEFRQIAEQRQLALDAAHMGWWHYDPVTKVATFDERYTELFGVTGTQKPNEEILRRIHPDDLPGLWAKVEAALDPVGPKPYRSEYRVNRDDGVQLWIEAYGLATFEGEGEARRAVSLVGTVADITERKEAEQAILSAREAAERASQAKDHFLAVLSHELRTPLTPVLATAQIMEADATLSAEQREAMRMIRRNVELEARLIDDLLDLTKIVRGKSELNMTGVDLHERLNHVVDMCRRDAASKQLRVTVVLDAGFHHVLAEPARLQQILWNLLKNAVKFTPAGGSIVVRTHNPDAGHVAVAIRDTGIGIAPDILARLFNAFEQGGKDVTRQFGGLGLGLAISKGLVDLHGGTLVVESEGTGKGATFTMTLGTVSQEVRETPPANAEAQFRKLAAKRRVLLVEDHPDTARVMMNLLKSFGFTVTLANCLKEALRSVESDSFDLLISDIGLPDGSGLELMQHVAATKPMKAFAMSGYGMEEDIRRSKEAGFLAHLTKPVDLKIFSSTLEEILGEAKG